MARIMTCDICGEEMASDAMSGLAMVIPEQSSTLRINMGDNSPGLLFEICPHCTQRVMDFIKNLTKDERFGDPEQTHGVSY